MFGWRYMMRGACSWSCKHCKLLNAKLNNECARYCILLAPMPSWTIQLWQLVQTCSLNNVFLATTRTASNLCSNSSWRLAISQGRGKRFSYSASSLQQFRHRWAPYNTTWEINHNQCCQALLSAAIDHNGLRWWSILAASNTGERSNNDWWPARLHHLDCPSSQQKEASTTKKYSCMSENCKNWETHITRIICAKEKSMHIEY